MNLTLELRKLKRTGLLPAMVLGGLLAAALPAGNLLFRADSAIDLSVPPLESLMNTNWMLMAMLNSFLMVLGACMIYHTEFADNAIERIDALPIRPWSVFLSKFVLLAAVLAAVFAMEGSSMYFCLWKWYSAGNGIAGELAGVMAVSFLLALPLLSLMLAVSSVCKNMWITVGVGVIGLFAAMLLQYVKGMQYFPFLLPYQPTPGGMQGSAFSVAAAIETILFLGAGMILQKVRRNAA